MRISDWSSDVCSSDLDKGSISENHIPKYLEIDPLSGTALRANKIRTYKRRCTKSSTITVHSSKNQKFFLPSTNSFPRARPVKSIHKIGEIPSLFAKYPENSHNLH